MILGKIELTEQTDLEFGLDVFGTTESAQYARLVIEGKDFDIACKCKIENGEVVAHVPKLKGILESGVYDVTLEVCVGDKIFKPLKEQIELNPLIEFDIKTKKVETVKEGVKVTTKKSIISEDTRSQSSETKLEKNIKSVIESGFEISRIDENYVMKKDNLYYGLISENAILESKVGFASLSELVEELSK